MSRYRILAILTLAQVGASIVQQGFGVLAPFVIADFSLSKAAFGVLFSAMVLGTARSRHWPVRSPIDSASGVRSRCPPA